MGEQVRFIRKNGRIIPIRKKKRSKSSLAGGLIASGIGLDLSASVLAEGLERKATKSTSEVSNATIRIKHKALFEKAGRPNIIRNKSVKGAFSFSVGSHSKLTDDLFMRNFGSKMKRRSIILGTARDEATMLHELGHLAASRRKRSFNRFHRGIALWSQKGIRKGKHRSPSFLAKGLVFKALRPFTVLGVEAEATAEAVNHVRKLSGKKAAFKTAKKLALPYATYALKGAGAGLAITGGALLVRQIVNSKGGK